MPRTARHPLAPVKPRAAIQTIVEAGAVRAVYQPIVSLHGGEPVGYEALARGPEGSPLESPLALFAAARDAGLLAELEWACRAAALRGALAAGLPASVALFLNVEPSLADQPAPAWVRDLFEEARGRLRLVFEITERELAERPADLLRRVQRLRALGGAIAIDDVGAEPRSLALMPFLEPHVIKLDLRLVQGRASAEAAHIMHAVSAEAERSGARVVAEGIETPAHERRALVLGADLGQGWLYGRPGALPAAAPSCSAPVDHFTAPTAVRYAGMAGVAAFVGALGHGLGAEPAAGVRGGDLTPEDPLRAEWNVAVVGPHFAAAFVGRDLGDDGPDMDRRFEFAITHDRALVIRTAAAMMARISPLT